MSDTFVYAQELKSCFKVKAHYYQLRIKSHRYLCRSVLEICHQKSGHQNRADKRLDALVVMMNPGSSKPLYQDSEIAILSRHRLFTMADQRELVDVQPDPAQYQLMRLMLQQEWSRIRLVNLSDLCQGNSQQFAHLHQAITELDPSHPESIVHPKRRAELRGHLERAPRVIAAWGKQAVLREQALAMLDEMDAPIGIDTVEPWFRFASPYRKDQKLEWLDMMRDRLGSKNNNNQPPEKV